MSDEDDYGSGIEDADLLEIVDKAEQLRAGAGKSSETSGYNYFDYDDIDDDIAISASNTVPSFQGWGAPTPSGGNLRQASLFASGQVRGTSSSQRSSQQARRNWPLAGSQTQEHPTHHKLDLQAAQTWVYPINVSFRDYQFNIVHRALFSNVLCALPTGWSPESLYVYIRHSAKMISVI
jgi:ATP-dependent DNA helicase MPH1